MFLYFQNEIESLRGYIDDQQTVITELQQHNSPFTSHSSQDTVVQLQKQVQSFHASRRPEIFISFKNKLLTNEAKQNEVHSSSHKHWK